MHDRVLNALQGSCQEGLRYARPFASLSAAWAACPRPDWMLTALELLNWPETVTIKTFAHWCLTETPLPTGQCAALCEPGGVLYRWAAKLAARTDRLTTSEADVFGLARTAALLAASAAAREYAASVGPAGDLEAAQAAIWQVQAVRLRLLIAAAPNGAALLELCLDARLKPKENDPCSAAHEAG